MGNICRSAMAQAVLQSDLVRLQLQDRVEVDSAGTHGGHEGERPDRRAVELAKARGYPQIEQQRARRVRGTDFETFDLILAMDRYNLEQLQDRCPPEHRHKLHLFLSYADGQAPLAADDCREVPDPYYGNAQGFEAVLGLCEAGSQGVLRRVASERLTS